jgi:hypothetical protein
MIGTNVTSFLESRDLTATDIPVFLLAHTALSAILVSSTWFLCYQTMAMNAVPSWTRPTSFVTNHPFVQKQTLRWSHQFEASAKSSKTVQRILDQFPAIDPARLTTSLVEAKVGRFFLKPVTIPGRVWLSLKATQGWHRIMHNAHEDDANKEIPTLGGQERNGKKGPPIKQKCLLPLCIN